MGLLLVLCLYCILLFSGAQNAIIENPVSDQAGRYKAI